MNVLLDTHVLLRWLADEPLSDVASNAIAAPDNVVYVSAASIWEISIKRALGKLEVDGDPLQAMGDDFEKLPIRFPHADLAGRLPPHHRDPFDRMLVAQAKIEQLDLVTRDHRLDAYDVRIIRA